MSALVLWIRHLAGAWLVYRGDPVTVIGRYSTQAEAHRQAFAVAGAAGGTVRIWAEEAKP